VASRFPSRNDRRVRHESSDRSGAWLCCLTCCLEYAHLADFTLNLQPRISHRHTTRSTCRIRSDSRTSQVWTLLTFADNLLASRAVLWLLRNRNGEKNARISCGHEWRSFECHTLLIHARRPRRHSSGSGKSQRLRLRGSEKARGRMIVQRRQRECTIDNG
jgi:hypothetical protein